MAYAPSQDERFDHARDLRKHDPRPGPIDQRAAVAGLIGYCESIAGSGLLNEPLEIGLRERIAMVLAAFDMPSKAERETAP